MPNFRAELEEFRSGDPVRDAQIGNLYRILIAQPLDPGGRDSYDAFFYPDDHDTIMGTAIAEEFGIGPAPGRNLVVISLRSLSPRDRDQTDLYIEEIAVRVEPDVDPYYVKIGSDLLFSKVEITSWKKPYLYSSAPRVITLTDRLFLRHAPKHTCYAPGTRRPAGAAP